MIRSAMLLVAGAWLLASCANSASSQPTSAPAQPTAGTAATSAPAEATAASEPTAAGSEPAPEPTSAASASQGGALDQITLQTTLLTNNLEQPIYATGAGDNSGRLFVVEKAGRIQIVRDGEVQGQPFLDITDRVGASGSEQGLLSVAFHPQFAANGQLYVDYTDRSGNTVISRFQASGESADAASEQVLLTIDQPYGNHNGGLVKFGPDGFLYIGMGDGGSGGDPQGNGQNPEALLGKLLRIDVDNGSPYGIPADNPYADGAAGAPEVWATGLRNPWRYSFDRATNDLYIADVGQNQIEEVDFLPAGSPGGTNFGWNPTEGSACYQGSCDPAQYTLPVAEYTHSEGGCSVTGGYVYRGEASPTLQGTYLYGDYCSGNIWGLQRTGESWNNQLLLESGLQISSFGQDDNGELYITNLGDNGLYQISAQ